MTPWPTAPFSPSSRSSEDVHPPQAPHPPQRPFSRGEPAVDAARLRRASLRAGYPASPASLTAGQEKEADALPSASASVAISGSPTCNIHHDHAGRSTSRTKNLRVVCRWLGRACHPAGNCETRLADDATPPAHFNPARASFQRTRLPVRYGPPGVVPEQHTWLLSPEGKAECPTPFPHRLPKLLTAPPQPTTTAPRPTTRPSSR